MPSTYRNRLVTAISNTPGGAGDLTIAAASSGYRTFAAADDGLSFDVSIVDGTTWEIRTGCVYTHAGTSLARGTLEDSSTGSAITLTSAAVVTVTATAGRANAGQTVLTQADRAANYGFFVSADGTNTQTLTDAGYRLLHGGSGGVFQTVEWNVGSIWSADSNGRVTPPDGRWQFYAQMAIQSVAANQRVFQGLYKNNVLHRMLGRTGGQASTTTSTGTGGTCVVEANGTDYFDLRVYVDGAGTHLTDPLAAQFYFGAEYRGPLL